MYRTSSPSRVGRQGPVGMALLVAVLTWGLAASVSSAQVQGWDTQTPRTFTYHIDILMDCDPNDPNLFREQDLRTLEVTVDSGLVELVRTSSIESSTEHFGPYDFHADGSLTLRPDDPNLPDDQKVPPMEALLLLRVFDQVPRTVGAGETWSYVDPESSELTLDHIELQQRVELSHLSTNYVGGATQYQLDIASELKLIDNLALSVLLGAPAERPADVQQTVQDLGQDGNLFLFGDVTWEVPAGATYGHTVSAQLTYVAAPFSGGTRASIASSVYRQEFTATLLP